MFNKYTEYINNLKAEGKSEHTIASYSAGIEPFLNHFRINTVEDIVNISKSEIVEYRNSINGKPSTVNARMRPVKAFLNWMVDMDYIETNPVSRIKSLKESKRVPLILTDEEVIAMLNACDNTQEKLMVAMMITTGMRVNELVLAKVSDVRENRILVHGKGDKERWVALQSWVVDLLNAHLSENKDEYLFPSRRGGDQVTTNAIRYRIKRIAKNAGVEEERLSKITPHSTRRYFATAVLNNGTDIAVVQQLMGHASINTTLRYAQVLHSTMDNALESKFGNFNNGK